MITQISCLKFNKYNNFINMPIYFSSYIGPKKHFFFLGLENEDETMPARGILLETRVNIFIND